MKTNVAAKRPVKLTHGGAPAEQHLKPIEELRRSVLSCFLWEDTFYESGEEISSRIQSLVSKCDPGEVIGLAVEARHEFHLRHVPLLLLVTLLKNKAPGMAEAINLVIRRADEPAELLAMYWKINGKDAPVAKQLKKGLAKALKKFNEYELAKYDSAEKSTRVRHVLFTAHPEPDTEEQAALWRRVIENKLAAPDTWEVELLKGADKKATFERLIREGKLGYLALLRNLRNMVKNGCDMKLVKEALLARKGGANRVLPFRFVAAAKACPELEPTIDEAMVANLKDSSYKLSGRTLVILDVSGSMTSPLSAKSDMNRMTVAAALGAISRELCEEPIIYATAGSDFHRKHQTEMVPARKGMALVDAIVNMCAPLGGGGIFLTQVLDYLRDKVGNVDRTIVITDEQDCDTDPVRSPKNAKPFGTRNYMINVASAQNGIGYGPEWSHINGFSENVIRYIYELEKSRFTAQQ